MLRTLSLLGRYLFSVVLSHAEDPPDPPSQAASGARHMLRLQRLAGRAGGLRSTIAGLPENGAARRAAVGGDLSEADEKLLAALYALRKRLAAKQNVPAYMVFSDATLREMVQSKPLSMDEFLNITGVGEKKAARYGMAFLRAIEDMVGSRE